MELDTHLGGRDRQVLSGTDVNGNALPAPVVDEDTDGGKGLGLAIGGHSRFLEIPLELTADDIVGGDGADGAEELHLLVADTLHVGPVGRLHAEESHDLHQVILDHVPKTSRCVVEGTTPIDPEGLGHGDLDIANVVAVPDRLEEGIGEAGVEDVLRRFLTEVVIDPEDLTLFKDVVKRPVQSLGRGLVVTEWLFHDNAGSLIDTPGGLESLGDRSEKNGRDGQIMDRTLGATQGLLEGLEGHGIPVVAVNILEAVGKLFKVRLVHAAPVGRDSLAGAVDDLLAGHAALGNADHRPLQHPPAIERLDGVEEFLMGQITGRSEEDQGVAFECGHGTWSG